MASENIWNDLLSQVEAQQLAFTPENSANKATSFSVLNHTLYPSVQAVATYVAASISGSGITALTGDVTATGPGSAAATIAAGAVTLSKMANMATASLLGRTTAGTGSPEVLSASAVRTLLGLVIGTNVQAWDADLDSIAGLSPSNDDFVQRKAGVWANRAVA